MLNDELRIYRGEDFVISEHIKIHQPSLSEICEYGEREYYSMIYNLTATPQSMKSQLWDIHIDYTTITPFELFYSLLYKFYPQEKTSILFGDLDLNQFQVMRREEDEAVLLWQCIDHANVIIDEFTYNTIIDYLRKVHLIQKDEKIPANETTKMLLIEDAKEEYERSKNRAYHSQLKNLISSMVNCEGFKYNHSQVWNMKINAFMDSVKRISKIKNADLLLQSGYSGFGVNLKEINEKQLNWLGELD
ncbi:MAG: hypothetical protein NC543_13640 [bacterium]|nr:hypothetical protein [bacterium]